MALERFKAREEIPQAEIDKMKYIPVGKGLAAKFLREANYDLTSEINKYPTEFKEYLIEGAQETLLNNISLPAEEGTIKTNKKSMQGLLEIKKDTQAINDLYIQIEHLFQYYTQTLAQTYRQFKDSFAAKINETVKMMEQRTGTKVKVNPEKQPGFREEWMKYLGRLNNQYEVALAEHKEKLRRII
ncbi:MAG: Serine protease inhibitor [Pelotomaculum thermopropionicum]|uniref:Serine protease inhibitor n=1 Tax=Pelotomaculum thermopropionicum TaxID=110500 RepID=A0A117M358_9FIRM|nr:MAG: Serine protease inhibitor [Pelotomaculum thermopropionicum]